MRTWIAVGAVVSLISINPLAQPQSPASLFTGCMEVELRVEGDSPRQESMIRGMAESRLRDAGLYRAPNSTGAINYLSDSTLRVEVSDSFFVRVSFTKRGVNLMTLTTAWETYAGDDEILREVLATVLDHFVVEYLRVNEEAC